MHMPTPLDFDTFFDMVEDKSKRLLLEAGVLPPNGALILYHKENQTMSHIMPMVETKQDHKNVIPAMGGVIWDAKPDYYAVAAECWMADNNNATLEKKVAETNGQYQHGTIASLPSEDKTEGFIIVSRTMDNKEHRVKMYEIVRERRNDESSKILELKIHITSKEDPAYDRMFDFRHGHQGNDLAFQPDGAI